MSDIVVASPPHLSKSNLTSIDDWRSVSTLTPNVLLEGPEVSTAAILLLLEPLLRPPIVRRSARAPLEFPGGNYSTLVLQEVAAMSGEDQARLVEWLDHSSQRRQLISTTAHSLFQRVECGLFDAVLYYRLNVMLLHVDPSDDHRLLADATGVRRRTRMQHAGSEGALRPRRGRRSPQIAS